MKTLLLALITPGTGKREGAIRGVGGVGKEAIIKCLIEGDGVKLVGNECLAGGEGAGELVNPAMGILQVVHAPSSVADSNPLDATIADKLKEVLGDCSASKLYGDASDLGPCNRGSWLTSD